MIDTQELQMRIIAQDVIERGSSADKAELIKELLNAFLSARKTGKELILAQLNIREITDRR